MTKIKNVLKYCWLLLLSAPIFASDEPAASPSRHARAIMEANALTKKTQVDQACQTEEAATQKLEMTVIYRMPDGSEKIKRIPFQIMNVIVPIMPGGDVNEDCIYLGIKDGKLIIPEDFSDRLFLEEGKVFSPKFVVDGTTITRLIEEIPMDTYQYYKYSGEEDDYSGELVIIAQCLLIEGEGEDQKIFRPTFCGHENVYNPEQLKIDSDDYSLLLPIKLEGENRDLDQEIRIDTMEYVPDPQFLVALGHIHVVNFTRNGQRITYSITKFPHYDESNPVETLRTYLYLHDLGFDRLDLHEQKLKRLDLDYRKQLHLASFLYANKDFMGGYEKYSHISRLLFLSHQKDPKETIKIFTECTERCAKAGHDLYCGKAPNCSQVPWKFLVDLFESRKPLYQTDPTQPKRDLSHFDVSDLSIKLDQLGEFNPGESKNIDEKIEIIDELIKMFNSEAEDYKGLEEFDPLIYYVKMIKDKGVGGGVSCEYWARCVLTNRTMQFRTMQSISASDLQEQKEERARVAELEEPKG